MNTQKKHAINKSLIFVLTLAIISLLFSFAGQGVYAATTVPESTDSFVSSELATTHYWVFSVKQKVITANLYNEQAADGANTMLSISGVSGYQEWNRISSGKSTITMDVSGLSDGSYTVTLWEARQGDTSGMVWSLASYELHIQNGIPEFFFAGGQSETSFLDGLLNYNPSDYDELPYLAGKMTHLDEVIKLAEDLTADKSTQEEKVKAIHDWIAQNISYDYESLNSGNTSEAADPDKVFEKRRGVCSGYSRLARIMFGAVGIPCLNINGFAQNNLLPGTEYDNSNHEWNAVYFDGRWWLVDITWDSLNKYYGDGSSENIQNQNPQYTYYGIAPMLFSTTHCSIGMYDFSDVTGIYLGNKGPLSFNVGDEFVYNGWIAFSTATDPTKYSIDPKYVYFSGYNMKQAGKQTVTVTFGKWTATYEITLTGTSIPEEPHVHSLEKKNAVAATCTTDGNIEYWMCKTCGELFSDVEGEKPIEAKDTVITKTGHTAGDVVIENKVDAACETVGSYDEVTYCKVCEKELSRTKKTVAALGHDWGKWIVVKEATEEAEGLEERVCGRNETHKETRVIPRKDHVHVLKNVEGKAASCTEAGNTEYWNCTNCGRYFKDAEGTIEGNLEDFSVPATGHEWSNPVYTWSKDYSTVTSTRTCTRDKNHVETETVSTTSKVTKEATCTAKGQTTYTAVFENAAFAKQTKKVSNIPATGHAYENVLVRATMSKDGSITPTCTVCGAKGKETVIRKIQTVALSKTSFVFNGSVQKPAVTVKDSAGKTIASKYYTATYSNKNSKNAGTYQVMVKFKGNYSGSKTLSYKITQAANSITKFTPTSKTYKYSKTNARTFQITATMKSGTKPTYAKSGVTPSKGNSYITVSKTGKVNVMKGIPRGTYTLKVKVTAKATTNYKAKTVTKSLKIVVK
ncbi:MAG: hypothetical protein IKF90_11970 [Parasporobacterium sp.]|nr:hypothetical protein [Parasporobacterium sp.]